MTKLKKYFQGEYLLSLHSNPIRMAQFFDWDWSLKTVVGGFPKGAADSKVVIMAPKYAYLGCLNLGNTRLKSTDKAFTGPIPKKVWLGDHREHMPSTCFVQVFEDVDGNRIGIVENPDDTGYYNPVESRPSAVFKTKKAAIAYYKSLGY
jgi:hypothetical protein